MSKKKDAEIFEKYFNEDNVEFGYMPSPKDDRDYTVENVSMAPVEIPKTYKVEGMGILN